MGGHIIPEADKANVVVMDTFAMPLSTSYTFCPLYMLTLIPLFGKNWKLCLSLLKILVGFQRMSNDFLFF